MSCGSGLCGSTAPAPRAPCSRALAEQVGFHHEPLPNRVRQAEADAAERDDRPTSPENEELRRLRKEVAELRRADEILKAASALSPKRSTRQGKRS